MAYIVLQHVSNKYAKSNEGKTLDNPVAVKYLSSILIQTSSKNYKKIIQRDTFIFGVQSMKGTIRFQK